MSRRKTRAPRPARRPSRPARRFRRWWTLPLVGLVILGFVLLRVWPRPRRAEPPAPPAQRLGAEAAFRLGITLSREGRHLAAAGCFATVARQAPGSWIAQQSYAGALFNGAQEVRLHLGKSEPVTRSSVERVGLVRASMLEARRADSLATTAQQRAVMAYQRGQTLDAYGLVSDAIVAFRSAAALDPSSAVIVRGVREAERRIASGGAR